MGRRGPPRKPTRLQVLKGNPGKRRLRPDPRTTPASPEDVPKYLKGNGRWLWDYLAPMMIQDGLLSREQIPTFVAGCEAWADYRTFKLLGDRVGAQLAIQMGYVRAARDARRDFVRIFSLFGMNPSALGSVTAKPSGTPDERAEEIRKKFFGLAGGRQQDLFGAKAK